MAFLEEKGIQVCKDQQGQLVQRAPQDLQELRAIRVTKELVCWAQEEREAIQEPEGKMDDPD